MKFVSRNLWMPPNYNYNLLLSGYGFSSETAVITYFYNITV